jgi:hypothetical protein
MSNVLFNVTMGEGLALSIDKNNPYPGSQLLLQNSRSDDPDQQWSWVFIPATQACVMFNPGRNLFAAPTSMDRGAPVVLFKPDMPMTDATTWQVTHESGAIRPPADTDLNLNALGDSWPIGTKVGIWSWGGGDPNETWTSRVVAT